MRADLHIHSFHSKDSSVSVRELVSRALALGLGALSIVDHNSIGSWDEIGEVKGLLVLPGVEVTSRDGHVLAYGVRGLVPRGMSVEETVEAIHDEGGIAVAPHPYRVWSGLGEGGVRKAAFDAIETINGRSLPGANRRARRLARSLDLPQVGGSDAHSAEGVGRAVTIFPDDCETADDMIDAILEGRTAVEGRGRPVGESVSYGIKCVKEWMLRGMRRI